MKRTGHNNEARSCNHCCNGKAVGIKFSECVFSIQRACAILPSAASSALRYYATLSHKRFDFRKKKIVTENKMYFLILCSLTVHPGKALGK